MKEFLKKMLRKFILKNFFYMPNWVFNLIPFLKAPSRRNQFLDNQSFVFLKLMPKIKFKEMSYEAIKNMRDLIIDRRTKYPISEDIQNELKKTDHLIENKQLTIREYEPENITSKKVILYFHGGGYVLNSIDTNDPMVSYFSEILGVKIFSLGYSLSPESKFPKATLEAESAFQWLIDQGYSCKDISLCGDSAGAHLAASLVHKLLEEKKSLPCNQFLIYPMCDPNCKSDSHKVLNDGYVLDQESMLWFWDKLKNSDDDLIDPKFNLLKINKWDEMPKTIIITAGFDPLWDEAEDYASILLEMGADVKQFHYPGMFHGFVSMTKLHEPKAAVLDFLNEYKKIL